MTNAKVLIRDLDPTPQEIDTTTDRRRAALQLLRRPGQPQRAQASILPIRAVDYARAIADRNLGGARRTPRPPSSTFIFAATRNLGSRPGSTEPSTSPPRHVILMHNFSKRRRNRQHAHPGHLRRRAARGVYRAGARLHRATPARDAAARGDYTRAQALANGALEAAYKRWQVYMAVKQASVIGSYTTHRQFPIDYQLAAAADQQRGQQQRIYLHQPEHRPGGPRRQRRGQPGHDLRFRRSHDQRSRLDRHDLHLPRHAVVTKTADPSLVVSVSRYFQQADASLFQAMLFFQNDLELHPGPAMTLYGLVHTNANLYAAAGSRRQPDLQFQRFLPRQPELRSTPRPTISTKTRHGYVEGVTATLYKQESGNWTNLQRRRPTPTRVNPALQRAGRFTRSAPMTSGAIDATNANASGTHEIIERPVPEQRRPTPARTRPSPIPHAFSAHRVYNSAGLRVLINPPAYTTPVAAPSQSTFTRPTRPTPENSAEIVPGTRHHAKHRQPDHRRRSRRTPAPGDIYDFREGRTINAEHRGHVRADPRRSTLMPVTTAWSTSATSPTPTPTATPATPTPSASRKAASCPTTA